MSVANGKIQQVRRDDQCRYPPNSWVASLAVDSWVGHFPLQDKKLCSRSLTSVQILHTQILNFVLKYVLIYCHVEMPERSTDRYRFLEHGHNLWLLCFIFDYHHIYLYSFEIASHQKFFSLSLYIYIHTYMSPLLVVFHQPAVGGEWCLATHLLCGFAQRRLRRSVVSFNACGSACALVVATRHHLTWRGMLVSVM